MSRLTRAVLRTALGAAGVIAAAGAAAGAYTETHRAPDQS
jgi:hypothetical protein